MVITMHLLKTESNTWKITLVMMKMLQVHLKLTQTQM